MAGPTEISSLLSRDDDKDESVSNKERHPLVSFFDDEQRGRQAVLWLTAVVVAGLLAATFLFHHAPPRSKPSYHVFPSDFVWGTATSSYQIEGAVKQDGRGETIWDVFSHQPGNTLNNATGDIACDHYNKMEDDVALLKSLGVKAYRFSIAWSRILPNGTGQVNPLGVGFYSKLIDTLLENNIEPWVTLYHWDLPQALEKEYGGWLDIKTSEAFAEYARICFERFGSRVKNWITINEAWTVSVAGYNNGVHAPGHKDKPTTEPYIVGHHLLLAHAKAARIYKRDFAKDQLGRIGISNCGDYRYPRTHSARDDEAAQRAMLFQFAWFTDPIMRGDYPTVMRKRLGDRLPRFSAVERKELLGSADFLGLNYYSSLLAAEPKKEPTFSGYWADIFVDFSDDSVWEKTLMGWNIVPNGLREMLLWISKRYDDPLIYITENGASFDETDLATSLHDEDRRWFFEGHLRACAEAIEAGVKLAGYFAWSALDNYEWQYSFQRRFGMFHVDFETLERTPKLSALWYRDTIREQGQNIAKSENMTIPHERRLANSSKRKLANTVLIGYGSNCDAVRRAVHDGVNVVVWAFMDIVASEEATFNAEHAFQSSRSLWERETKVVTNLDITAITELIDELDESGYNDVVHLVSFGGWDGPHIEPNLFASEWYSTWKREVGEIFHGIDWDLEGNDLLASKSNVFTVDCLDKMGEISRLAKQDGYIVSMAPPQSYLDQSSSRFSRYVNLTTQDPSRRWHDDFEYFGANVYAYLLAKYGDEIDLVCVQLYESYSRTAQAVNNQGIPPELYLEQYVSNLRENNFQFFVDFSDDPAVQFDGMNVTLPLSKLVFGLGNGWADNDDDKQVFISPQQVRSAWFALELQDALPRGFMFWTIDEEGTNGVYFARGLNNVLHIRP